MKTAVEPLEGNKVKLSVEVDEQEFERELDAAFRRIAREVRIPGFRPGKVPRRILEARIGTEAARQDALRESLPNFYARAVNETETDVIAPPEIDITGGQESGPVVFDAVVEIRPKISVPGYGSLRVTIPSPKVSDEDIDEQVERLRSQFGELESVDRAARNGDYARIDIAGSVDGEPLEGLTADDYSYQLGSEAVVPEIDARLTGAKVGDILAFDAPAPDDPESDDEETTISFRILVKDVQEQVLPDLDDEWANEASELETLDELREDFRTRLAGMKRGQSEIALREGVIASLVDLVDEEPPEALVNAEIERRGRDLVQRLSAQGANLEQYLQMTGQAPGELSEALRSAAIPAVKADLGLRAVIDAEHLDVDDDEIDDEIARIAERVEMKAPALRRQLERAEQMQAIRSDLQKGKALEWLADRAEVVDEDGTPIARADMESPEDEFELEAATPAEEQA